MIATGIGIAAQLLYIKELLDGHEKAQMLYVSIYDLLRAYLEDEIQYIGENGLIDVRSGRVSWEKQLDIEIGN
ncbi:unnamed protein product [Penicillium roqueforti FM164]|uniref:Genomic scaffold, ProqFM164S02 n=1 Tax=Penicillium roqueforti (strain FM164) TaxID=1365484 RepID=W6Q8F4_PENRF|nr:unnamed protein product [Penicillium roqueforti FM164]